MGHSLRAASVPGALGLLFALAVPPAHAGARVGIEGAAASVEVPAGWVVAPVSTDAPYLQLTLCDPARSDANSCLVLGEMSIEQLVDARAPASLDAVLEDARARHAEAKEADRLSAPRRLTVSGHDAVEQAGVGDIHYNYGPAGSEWGKMAFHSLTLHDGSAFYRCNLSVAPTGYSSELRRALHQFCSSLQSTGSHSQSGQQ